MNETNVTVSNVGDQLVNSTKVSPPNEMTVISYWMYIFVYGTATLLNLPMFIGIVADKSLRVRREMVLIGEMALCEIVAGTSYVLQGIVPLIRLQYYSDMLPFTPVDCLWQFYVLHQMFAGPCLTMTLLVTSIDRMICVCSWQMYSKLSSGRTHQWLLLCSPVVYGLSQLGALIGSAYSMPQKPVIHPASCSGAVIQTASLGSYLKATLLIMSVGSVALYAIAIIVMKVQQRNVVVPCVAEVQRERNRSITKFLGLVAIITFFTLALPRLISFVNNAFFYNQLYVSSIGSQFVSYITIATNFHALLYAMVFWLRSTKPRNEVIDSLRKLLGMKTTGGRGWSKSVSMNNINSDRQLSH